MHSRPSNHSASFLAADCRLPGRMSALFGSLGAGVLQPWQGQLLHTCPISCTAPQRASRNASPLLPLLNASMTVSGQDQCAKAHICEETGLQATTRPLHRSKKKPPLSGALAKPRRMSTPQMVRSLRVPKPICSSPDCLLCSPHSSEYLP